WKERLRKSWFAIPSAFAHIQRWHGKALRISWHSCPRTSLTNRSICNQFLPVLSNTMTKFNDQVVLVTGGGAGIGLSAASKFAKEGARVVITGRRREALEEAAHIAACADYIVADAGNPADATRTIE